jgi:tetratricopeptide (TPR) repeat protein
MKSCLRNAGILLVLLAVSWSVQGEVRATPNDFQRGNAAYEQKDFELAAQLFAACVTNEMSAGAWQNLGNSQWQLGWTAEALIAWERARALDPFAADPENNLKFVRDTAQLEAPELTWCEIAAGWLPAGWWAWLACGSFWFAMALLLLPGVLRWRRAAGQQALVALGLGVFLLTVPANYGVWTRTHIGLVLASETSLRYTPTAEGEPVTRLSAGEPARVVRKRGNYMLIQTRRGEGWVEQRQLSLLFPR